MWTLASGGFKDAISRGPGWRRCKCETMAGWDGPSVIPITHITELDEGIGRGSWHTEACDGLCYVYMN